MLEVFKDKRILLTGDTGFKGCWLKLWLESIGAKVVGLSVDIPTQPSLYQTVFGEPTEEFVDIGNRQRVRERIQEAQPEIIFHLAAQPIVLKSYDIAYETFFTNTVGTLNLLEELRSCGSLEAGVLITTDKCYRNEDLNLAFSEENPLGGKDPYSASKAGAEIVAHSYFVSFFKELGIPMATARAGNVIGGGDFSEDRILADCYRATKKRNKLNIRNRYSTRPWQHVLDCLSGYLQLASKLLEKRSEVLYQSFNFGPGEESEKTVEELVVELQKTWPDLEYQCEPVNKAKTEAAFLRLNIEKAKRSLEWEPVVGFEKACHWTACWYAEFLKTQNSDTLKNLCLHQIQEFEGLMKSQSRQSA